MSGNPSYGQLITTLTITMNNYLFECFRNSLGIAFNDSLYQLTVADVSLIGKKKQEIRELAKQIASIVKSNQNGAKSQYGVVSHSPIPWSFRPLSVYERDETMPATGVGVSVSGEIEGIWTEGQSDISRESEIAKVGYADAFDKVAKDAAEKFTKYADSLKLLLVQFFGNSSSILREDDIVEIIQSAKLPEMIDQVWLADQEWVNLNEYEIVWKRTR